MLGQTHWKKLEIVSSDNWLKGKFINKAVSSRSP